MVGCSGRNFYKIILKNLSIRKFAILHYAHGYAFAGVRCSVDDEASGAS